MVQSKRSLSPTPSVSPAPSSTTSPKSKKSKTTPKKSSSNSPSKSPKKVSNGSGSDGGKKMGSWTGEELKMLYNIMCPKRTGVNWKDVSEQIPGRDMKSCQNKWARMQGKVQQAIEQLGE